jgi:uncharacterized membrane protein
VTSNSSSATPARFALAFIAVAIVFGALDAVWLSTMADALYRPAIGHLMMERFALLPALLFYAIYLTGVVVFAVLPGLATGRVFDALRRGALFGFVAYATYDLTNQATLKGWPWRVTLFDLAWGTLATATASAAATFAVLALMRRRG